MKSNINRNILWKEKRDKTIFLKKYIFRIQIGLMENNISHQSNLHAHFT